MAMLTLVVLIYTNNSSANDNNIIDVTPMQVIRSAQEANYTAVIKHKGNYISINSCNDVNKLVETLANKHFTITSTITEPVKSTELTCVLHANDTSVEFTVIKI